MKDNLVLERQTVFSSEWLRKSLAEQIHLPRFAPDEPIHLRILRLLPKGDRHARMSLSNASVVLIEEFCESRAELSPFFRELLLLVAALRPVEVISLLHSLALSFFHDPIVPVKARQATLIALTDMHSALSFSFWSRMVKEDPENHIGIAFAAMSAANLNQAITFLPHLPNDSEIAQYIAVNVDLAVEKFTERERAKFFERLRPVLRKCQEAVATSLNQWLDWKISTPATVIYCESLKSALIEFLGEDVEPRTFTPKLCEEF